MLISVPHKLIKIVCKVPDFVSVCQSLKSSEMSVEMDWSHDITSDSF